MKERAAPFQGQKKGVLSPLQPESQTLEAVGGANSTALPAGRCLKIHQTTVLMGEQFECRTRAVRLQRAGGQPMASLREI